MFRQLRVQNRLALNRVAAKAVFLRFQNENGFRELDLLKVCTDLVFPSRCFLLDRDTYFLDQDTIRLLLPNYFPLKVGTGQTLRIKS